MMKKDTITASIFSTFMIGLGIVIFLVILPYLFIWASLLTTNKSEIIELENKAIKYSTFKFQKTYTRINALPLLSLSKKYDKVIEYYNDLEKMNTADSMSQTLAIMAYIELEDYDNAIKYAKKLNNKSLLAKAYIKNKNFGKAKPIVEELLAKNISSINALLYKSEILLHENRLKEAQNTIDNVLKTSPSYIEAYYVKAEILTKYGKIKEANKYINEAKALELKRRKLYQ